MKKPIQVLVVDDEIKILEIVKSYLEKSGYRALAATNGTQALAILEEEPVSLLLLDLMLPDLSGEEICRTIRKKSTLPIIMMTAKVDEESIIAGLNMGADDYVTKPFSPRQLMARVAAALRRTNEGEETGLRLRIGGIEVDLSEKTVRKNGEDISLTPNEYRILTLLMKRPNKIFTRDEIITYAKTDGYDGNDRTIDSHIKNLRQKVEEDSRSPQYIITVYGVGYRFGGEKP